MTRSTKLFYKLLRFTRQLIGFGQYGLIEISVRAMIATHLNKLSAEVENQW